MNTPDSNPAAHHPHATDDSIIRSVFSVPSVVNSNGSDPEAHFLPYQLRWIKDSSRLKIIEKSRQIGLTYADAYDSVRKACGMHGYYDTWFSTRDEATARRYIELCKDWARFLNLKAKYLGYRLIDAEKDLHAHDLKFASGLHIFSLSSSPDALVGKTGHIKLDEFAVHRDGGQLFRIAKPGTQWGGHISIISTHRGENSAFNNFLRDIKERGNPMGWSHHRVTLYDAVAQGLVEKINKVSSSSSSSSSTPETRDQFLARTRAECLDEEHWRQEYCCVPVAASAAFLSLPLIAPCETSDCMVPLHLLNPNPNLNLNPNLARTHNPLYVGVDLARREHLCVIDVGELVGDVLWDRVRLELRNKTFAEIREELFRVLELPNVRCAAIDATGLGMQLAEEAKAKFDWRVQPITFTPEIKEILAFTLRRAFEQHRIRIESNSDLRGDLLSMRKEVSNAGHIRFVGETNDGHCDRFWAKALRQHAAACKYANVGAAVA